MPEGDAVHVAARKLDAALSGHALTRTDLRVPRFATADLSGQTVMETVARGKHLLTRTDAGVTLHTHFRMEGTWRIRRLRERLPGPAHEIRAILETDRHRAVGLRLGIVELLKTAHEDRVVGHLGPDVLGPDWDAAAAVANLARDPTRPIGEAVIDQRLLSGPGNIYKSEALFLRGVHPWIPAGDVGLPALVDLVKRLMEANRSTGRQITTGDTRRGRERWVYGRDGEPCRRCGTPIERDVQGRAPTQRVTYWCPRCQPAAAEGG